MSYLTETGTSNRKLTALGLAVIVHVFIIYALLTGLASDAYKKIVKATEATEIKVEKPKEVPPPPPPEKLQEIPVVTPPPIVDIQQDRPRETIQAVVSTRTDVAPSNAVTPTLPPPEVKPEPKPEPKAVIPGQAARLRGNMQSLITADDYPDSSLRSEEEGVTAVKIDVTEKGRVENCVVTSSSGHPKLDEATCNIVTRRGRYDPAKAEGGAPMRSTSTFRFRWVVPKDR